jgi:hypothetical protein
VAEIDVAGPGLLQEDGRVGAGSSDSDDHDVLSSVFGRVLDFSRVYYFALERFAALDFDALRGVEDARGKHNFVERMRFLFSRLYVDRLDHPDLVGLVAIYLVDAFREANTWGEIKMVGV